MNTFDFRGARGGGGVPRAVLPPRPPVRPPRSERPNRERGLRTSALQPLRASPPLPKTVSGLRVRTPSPGAAAVASVGAPPRGSGPVSERRSRPRGRRGRVGCGARRGSRLLSLARFPCGSCCFAASASGHGVSPRATRPHRFPRGAWRPLVLPTARRSAGPSVAQLCSPEGGQRDLGRRDRGLCARPASPHDPPGGFSS